MKVFNDLLPASFTAKPEPSSKDSRQKKEQHKSTKNLLPKQDDGQLNKQDDVITDRRVGEDRREQALKRGRWLESRDRKDRRATNAAISVKI